MAEQYSYRQYLRKTLVRDEVSPLLRGDYVMFSLVGARVLFTAPYVAGLVASLGVGAGEPFSVGKFEHKQNGAREVRWWSGRRPKQQRRSRRS